jgi:hypothetical protein
VDGLLLTRRERLRGYSQRTGLIIGPSLVLALAELAYGDRPVALFIFAVSALTALAVGSMVETKVGATVFGLLLFGAIVGFLLMSSWLVSHPIQRGD